jgi:hypothetical protein
MRLSNAIFTLQLVLVGFGPFFSSIWKGIQNNIDDISYSNVDDDGP